MQRVHVADFVRLQVAGAEALTGLPVIECDAHFISARRQGAYVDFPAQRDVGARANASVGLGDALAAARVDDMDSEGMAVEERFVFTAQAGPEAQSTVTQLWAIRRKQRDSALKLQAATGSGQGREEQLQGDP